MQAKEFHWYIFTPLPHKAIYCCPPASPPPVVVWHELHIAHAGHCHILVIDEAVRNGTDLHTQQATSVTLHTLRQALCRTVQNTL